jgi:hypothetical protein
MTEYANIEIIKKINAIAYDNTLINTKIDTISSQLLATLSSMQKIMVQNNESGGLCERNSPFSETKDNGNAYVTMDEAEERIYSPNFKEKLFKFFEKSKELLQFRSK